MQFSCHCVRLEFSQVLGWVLSTVPGILWNSALLQLLCPCFTLKNHTGTLFEHRKREHICLSSQLSVSSGVYSAVLGCADQLREMTRSTGHDSKIQTHAVELKGAVRGKTDAGQSWGSGVSCGFRHSIFLLLNYFKRSHKPNKPRRDLRRSGIVHKNQRTLQ